MICFKPLEEAEDYARHLVNDRMCWHFKLPAIPHFGGACEEQRPNHSSTICDERLRKLYLRRNDDFSDTYRRLL